MGVPAQLDPTQREQIARNEVSRVETNYQRYGLHIDNTQIERIVREAVRRSTESRVRTSVDAQMQNLLARVNPERALRMDVERELRYSHMQYENLPQQKRDELNGIIHDRAHNYTQRHDQIREIFRAQRGQATEVNTSEPHGEQGSRTNVSSATRRQNDITRQIDATIEQLGLSTTYEHSLDTFVSRVNERRDQLRLPRITNDEVPTAVRIDIASSIINSLRDSVRDPQTMYITSATDNYERREAEANVELTFSAPNRIMQRMHNSREAAVIELDNVVMRLDRLRASIQTETTRRSV